MIHAASEIILEWLIGKAFATRYNAQKAWPVFFNSMPTEPDNIIAVFDTIGRKDGRLMGTGKTIIHPGINIRVRATKASEGWKKSSDILEAFDTVKNDIVTFGGRIYRINSVTRATEPIPLGQEQGKTRLLYSLNVLATISDITP